MLGMFSQICNIFKYKSIYISIYNYPIKIIKILTKLLIFISTLYCHRQYLALVTLYNLPGSNNIICLDILYNLLNK